MYLHMFGVPINRVSTALQLDENLLTIQPDEMFKACSGQIVFRPRGSRDEGMLVELDSVKLPYIVSTVPLEKERYSWKVWAYQAIISVKCCDLYLKNEL